MDESLEEKEKKAGAFHAEDEDAKECQDADAEVAVDDAEHKGKPRLMIKKMVLENFKSYQGTRVIGPFHKVIHRITNHMVGGGHESDTSTELLVDRWTEWERQVERDRLAPLCFRETG